MNKAIFTVCKTTNAVQHFPQAVATDVITWNDIHDYFSTHTILNVELIQGSKINIPKRGLYQHRDFILQHINANATFCITRFYNVNKQCFELWETFCDAYADCGVDFHVFGGLSEAAQSFPPHNDLAANYIVQLDGQCEWIIYNEQATQAEALAYKILPENQLTVQTKILMNPGDVLYIPSGKYHKCKPRGKRLSLSIPIL